MKSGKLGRRMRRMSFQTRSFLLLLGVALAVSLLIGVYSFHLLQGLLYEQIGARALVQARQIAVLPEVVDAVNREDSAQLKRIILPLMQESDASYIVIGDARGRHLMHTDPSISVGSPMQGEDNELPLRQGRSETTLKRGTLGLSWRAKAPVRNRAGQVVGVVSVGYFASRIAYWNQTRFMPVLTVLLWMLMALLWCAWRFSRSIKRQMRNLEPHEIAGLVRQQEAVFESIFEGVIAIDRDGYVTGINRAARDMLNLPPEAALPGQALVALIPDCAFVSPTADQADCKDEICLFGTLQVIASRVGIHAADGLQGWVISFRRQDDINTLSMQLSQIRRYADHLRVVRHEHLNWMSTVSGLLHVKAYDEVMRLVRSQSEVQQQVLDEISMSFGNYHLCGLLIGKYYRAQEMGLSLQFESGCSVDALPEVLSDVEWMSIVGNLLDNAFEASRDNPADDRDIVLYLSDVGEELIIEVADHGCGVDPALAGQLFERGSSSRGGGEHGIGLYLVNSYVQKAGGTITVENNIPRGTIFSVFVPKRRRDDSA